MSVPMYRQLLAYTPWVRVSIASAMARVAQRDLTVCIGGDSRVYQCSRAACFMVPYLAVQVSTEPGFLLIRRLKLYAHLFQP